jgi:large subunit ribosomal protein L37Ae
MSKRTKKVGIAGRYRQKYGVKVRRSLQEADLRRTATYKCPRCEWLRVKRVSSGIWQCRHCDHKFVGGAYSP